MATKKKLPPWGDVTGGKPIERFYGDDHFALGEQIAREEQFRRMLALKKHYDIDGETGWRPWYDLVIAIVSEFEDGLKIIDPPPEPPGAKAWRNWSGAAGHVLVKEIEAMKEQSPGQSVDECLRQAIDIFGYRYGDMDFDTFKVRYYEALKIYRSTE